MISRHLIKELWTACVFQWVYIDHFTQSLQWYRLILTSHWKNTENFCHAKFSLHSRNIYDLGQEIICHLFTKLWRKIFFLTHKCLLSGNHMSYVISNKFLSFLCIIWEQSDSSVASLKLYTIHNFFIEHNKLTNKTETEA